MLQRMRERISGWIAGVIFALVAVAFVLFGVDYYFQGNSNDHNLIATVNGEKITRNEVDLLFSNLQQQALIRSGGRPLDDTTVSQLKSIALQSIISNTALLTALHRDGFRMPEAAAKMMITQDPEFQENGQFSEKHFLQMLSLASLSPIEFLKRLQSEMLVRQVMNGVSLSGFALPNEADHIYALSDQKRAFGYFIVSSNQFLNKVHISQQNIEQFYQQNRQIFQTPEKVSVNYLLLSPTEIAKTIQVSEAQAKQYYESNIANYQVPARWQVLRVTIPVEKDAKDSIVQTAKMKAEEIALQLKQKNTITKGAIETLSAADMNDSLRSVLASMKVNAVSSPLRTSDGFTLLKVLQIHPETTHPFESVKGSVMDVVKHQRVNQLFSSSSSRLADLTYTNPNSLMPASKALGLKIQTSESMTKEGESKGIFSNSKVMAAIFSDSVFHENNNSDPIDLSDGSQIVVRVNQKIPSKQLPLNAEVENIKKQLTKERVKAEAGLLAYQLQQELAKGVSPSELAQKNGLKWQTVSLRSRLKKNAKNSEEIITDTAFSTPVTETLIAHQPLGVNTVLLPNGEYAVIAISHVVNADINNISTAERNALADKLSLIWGNLFQQFYVENIVSSAKVVMHAASPT